MEQYPPIPHVGDESAPELDGHLWLLEAVEGSLLRFQVEESGQIRFGGEQRTFSDLDDAPAQCRRAVRHVRERLNRDALRRAVDDVTALTFVGWATHRDRIDYDWARLPPFLGFDVRIGGESRPPDAVEAIFDQLGLDPANAVAREVNSRDFDPGDYTQPASEWYDGPAAGVVIRDKRGGCARLGNSGISSQYSSIVAEDAAELAATVGTDRRFQRAANRLRTGGQSPTVADLSERVLDDVFREEHGRLFEDGRDIDREELRAAVAGRAQRFLHG